MPRSTRVVSACVRAPLRARRRQDPACQRRSRRRTCLQRRSTELGCHARARTRTPRRPDRPRGPSATGCRPVRTYPGRGCSTAGDSRRLEGRTRRPADHRARRSRPRSMRGLSMAQRVNSATTSARTSQWQQPQRPACRFLHTRMGTARTLRDSRQQLRLDPLQRRPTVHRHQPARLPQLARTPAATWP